MKNKNIEYCKCPFCGYTVEIDVAWAKKNGRVFCGTCCKAFDLRIEEDDEDEIPEGLPNKDANHYKWKSEEVEEKEDKKEDDNNEQSTSKPTKDLYDYWGY